MTVLALEHEQLIQLADLVAERLAARLGGLMAGESDAEVLVDAAEIARRFGKTRSWVYDHAGQLGAVKMGSGTRPRLGFSPARAAAGLNELSARRDVQPAAGPTPSRRRAPRAERTAAGAPLLPIGRQAA